MPRPRVVIVRYHNPSGQWRVYANRRDLKNGVGHFADLDRKQDAVKVARESIVSGEIAILRVLDRDGDVQSERKFGY